MPVCEECETSVDKFSLLSTPIQVQSHSYEVNRIRKAYNHMDSKVQEYNIQVREGRDLKAALETGLFAEYNDLRRNYEQKLKTFNPLLASIERLSKTGEQFHILDIYHFIGNRHGYEKIFSKVLLNAVVASEVELKTSHWELEGEFTISPFQEYTDEQYLAHILGNNLSGPQAMNFRRDPPKDLMKSIQEILAIMREISEGHLQNWEENKNTNNPGSLGGFASAEISNMREVKEFCPACGSLEWQGIHVDVGLSVYIPGTEAAGIEGQSFEYKGRITEISEHFLPEIVKAGQQKLVLLQKRFKAFEKFNKGIEKKVKRRLKKRADDKKKAEIKALKAKLRALEEE